MTKITEAVEQPDAPIIAEPLPPEGENEGIQHAEQVRARVVSGAKVLGFRTLISLLLRGVSAFTLSHMLVKEDYGLFGVVAVVAGLGGYFSDFGMGAALVQQQREPTDSELTTVFWCQQVFTGVVIGAILLGMPWLLPYYKVPPSATTLLIAMTLGLWLSSLRVVPVMSMERKLRFEAQAGCEMFENVVQVVATISLAAFRLGAWSLVAGGLIGRALGLAAIWYASPWRPRGRFDAVTARVLLMRGLAFQINSVLPTLLSFPTPLIISNRLGYAGLGLFNWANNLASSPMMLSSILNRVAFPAYSRLQDQPEELARLSGNAVQKMGMLLSLVAAPLVLAAPLFIPLVFSEKWNDAVPLFQFGLLNAVIEVQLGLIAQTLSASGHINRLVQLQIVSGVLRLVALAIGITAFKLIGVAVFAYIASVVVLFILLAATRQMIQTGRVIINQGMKPILIVHIPVGIAMFLGLLTARTVLPHTDSSSALGPLTLQAAVSMIIFAGLVAVFDLVAGEHPVRTELRSAFRLLVKKRSAGVNV